MRRWRATILATLLCAGCGGHPATPNVDPSAATSASDPAAQAPPPPTHQWAYREGKLYGYPSALSDDDQKAGKAAGDIVMFRYLGERGGVYSLASEDGQSVLSCENPCEVIKVRTPFGIQRTQFNPDSVAGAALTDAFNGQLEAANSKLER